MIQRLLLNLALAAGPALGASAQIGPLPGMAVLPPSSVAVCVPVVTDLGTATSPLSGTTVTKTVTVPGGSLVVVAVEEDDEAAATTTMGAVTDGTNTYTRITTIQLNNSSTVGILGIFYSANVTALSSATLTYTKTNAGNPAQIAALYSSNIATVTPLDTAVTATAFGNGTPPSVTSGTPAQAGELFVGGLGADASQTFTFTQDTTHGWATPPDYIIQGPLGPGIFSATGGGSQINAGTGTKIFSPTINVGVLWGEIVVGFKHC